MKITTILIFFCASFKISLCQLSNKEELIKVSKAYYQSIKNSFILVTVKGKSTIAEDTSFARYECFIDGINHNKLFLLSSDNGIFVNDSKEYFLIFPERKKYENVKNSDKKYTIYQTRYKNYPFVEPVEFFNNLSKPAFKFQMTESNYVLTDYKHIFEFRKSDFSLKRMIHLGYSIKDKGVYYQETRFNSSVNDSLVNSQINNALAIIQSKQNELKSNDDNLVRVDSFDLSLFKNDFIRVINFPDGILANKIVLIDFFYEACMPCVKSYPIMNKFFENRDSNFIVIGVDPRLSDTLHMTRYLERYGIKYPVVYGRKALEMSQKLGIHGYPTFVIVDPSGKILEFQEGHSQSFFKKVEKKYLRKNE